MHRTWGSMHYALCSVKPATAAKYLTVEEIRKNEVSLFKKNIDKTCVWITL